MSDDYTPTTDEVREECVYGWQEVDMDGNVVVSIFEATDRFERWLAAHDDRVKAEALRDMADRIDRGPDLPLPPNVHSALVRERADDIEAGDTGGR